jgi:hypothetical protein
VFLGGKGNNRGFGEKATGLEGKEASLSVVATTVKEEGW